MIKPEELRIGNYFYLPNGKVGVITYHEIRLLVVAMDKPDYNPIPINEQWLKDFNLPCRKVKTEIEYNEYSIRNSHEIYCYMDGSGNCLFWIGGEFIIKCDSVHVFQNTYNILNPHEELTKQ